MFDAQCDLAALVYERDQDPDAVLRDFRGGPQCPRLSRGRHGAGRPMRRFQPVGRAGSQRRDATLAQDFDLRRQAAAGSTSAGCRTRPPGSPSAMDAGADLVIVNRFGKRERDGKGLSHLIERALDADIPVVIAVSSDSFADWIKFAGGMSVKLACDPTALGQWWNNVSMRGSEGVSRDGQTVCDFK